MSKIVYKINVLYDRNQKSDKPVNFPQSLQAALNVGPFASEFESTPEVKKFEERKPAVDGGPPPTNYYAMDFKYDAWGNVFIARTRSQRSHAHFAVSTLSYTPWTGAVCGCSQNLIFRLKVALDNSIQACTYSPHSGYSHDYNSTSLLKA